MVELPLELARRAERLYGVKFVIILDRKPGIKYTLPKFSDINRLVEVEDEENMEKEYFIYVPGSV